MWNKSTAYDVKAFADQLTAAFNILVYQDTNIIHPMKFCKACKVGMGRILEKKMTTKAQSHHIIECHVHTEQCKVHICSYCQSLFPYYNVGNIFLKIGLAAFLSGLSRM